MENTFKIFLVFFATVVALGNAQFNLHSDAIILQKFLEGGLLKRLANHVEDNEQYLSGTCALDVLAWKLSPHKMWAWRMHDANGKFPSGLLRANFHSLGQYDECMLIDEPQTFPKRTIKGKYCVANFGIKEVITSVMDLSTPQNFYTNLKIAARTDLLDQLPNFMFNLGICIPHSCTGKDIGDMMMGILKLLNLNTTAVPQVYVSEEFCSVAGENQYEWETGDIVAVTLLSCFAGLLLFSTIYDVCSRGSLKESPFGHDVIRLFSMYTNTKRIIKPNNSPTAIKCLNGIRVITILWIILCHRYSISTIFPIRNWIDIVYWVRTYGSMFLVGGTVAVDTFFMLSGLLLSYIFFNQMEKKKSFNLGLFYLHRFLRLWPAMAATIMFSAVLLKHLGDGPLWPTAISNINDPCANNWWKTLLFVQNYVSPNDQCPGHLWYLAVDTQLYILSPIVLLPLYWKPKFGKINMIFWILAQQATLITIVYLNDWGSTLSSGEFMAQYYFPTHMRAAPWLIGFAAGYLMYKSKDINIDNQKLSTQIIALLMWVISLGILLAVILGQKPLNDPFHLVSKAADGTFNAFSRTGWALALVWIVFACQHGLGGPINWFLSLYYWEILAKFTYSMYLTHITFQHWQSGSTRVVNEFAHLPFIYTYFGDVFMTLLASFFWANAFEFPFIAFESVLFPNENLKIKTIETKMDIPIDDKNIMPVESAAVTNQNSNDDIVSAPIEKIYPKLDEMTNSSNIEPESFIRNKS